MTSVITGNIKNAQLLTVEGMSFLYGEVEKEHLHRWQKGDCMCSSLVNRIDVYRKLFIPEIVFIKWTLSLIKFR
jgi:hypothetical protein